MRARYQGQQAGDESRTATASMDERLMDNEIVEGEEVATMRQMFSTGHWPELNRYTDSLRHTGWSLERIQSMLTRAMCGVRMPRR